MIADDLRLLIFGNGFLHSVPVLDSHLNLVDQVHNAKRQSYRKITALATILEFVTHVEHENVGAQLLLAVDGHRKFNISIYGLVRTEGSSIRNSQR